MRRLPQFGLLLFLLIGLTACQPITAPSPTAAPLPTQTVESVQTEIVAESLSPDGAWLATTRAAFATDEYYQELTVEPAVGGDARILLAQWSPLGLGYTLPMVRRWSNDGETLYFTHQPVVDGCALFAWSEGLYAAHYITGSTQQILKTRAVPMAVAPDENQVAWFDRTASQLVIHNIQSSSVQTYSVALDATGNTDAGNLAWDPTSTQLAFALAHEPCTGMFAAATSIVMLDTINDELEVLLPEDTRKLLPVAWDDPTAIVLEDRAGIKYLLDPASGEVTPAP